MAPIVLTQAEVLAAMALGSSDLKFLLEKQDVDQHTSSLPQRLEGKSCGDNSLMFGSS